MDEGEVAFYVLCIICGALLAIGALKLDHYWLTSVGIVTMLGAAITWRLRHGN
jgi:type IV secretory pathway VirB2 component (pilin)